VKGETVLPLEHRKYGSKHTGLFIGVQGNDPILHQSDSERAQADNGWTDDETEAVIAKVEYFVQRQPGLVWRLEAPRFAAPWPSYDDMHHNQIATTAQATGQIGEALRYEEQNKARPVVVERLTALLNESRDAVAAEAALTAA
jgi:hypothetical protein